MRNGIFLIALVALFVADSARAGDAAIVSGTAFAITHNGHLLTNAHVVGSVNAKLVVQGKSGSQLNGHVISIDTANDLAVVKISVTTKPLTIRSKPLKKGEAVFTIGYPHIDVQGTESKVTDGVTSALSGLRGDPRFVQISVPVQSGNSGGPLMDTQGHVVGVVSAKLDAQVVLKATGDLTQNVNYALKVAYAEGLIESLPGVTRGSALAAGGSLSAAVVQRIEESVYLILSSRPTVSTDTGHEPRDDKKPGESPANRLGDDRFAGLVLQTNVSQGCVYVSSPLVGKEWKSTFGQGECITHCIVLKASETFRPASQYVRVFVVDDVYDHCMRQVVLQPNSYYASFKLQTGEYRTVAKRKSPVR
jgi:hypothetical protein